MYMGEQHLHSLLDFSPSIKAQHGVFPQVIQLQIVIANKPSHPPPTHTFPFCCVPKVYLLPGNLAVGPLHPTPIHAAIVDDVSVSTFLAG
jgi:hypothetical protein